MQHIHAFVWRRSGALSRSLILFLLSQTPTQTCNAMHGRAKATKRLGRQKGGAAAALLSLSTQENVSQALHHPVTLGPVHPHKYPNAGRFQETSCGCLLKFRPVGTPPAKKFEELEEGRSCLLDSLLASRAY